MRFETDQFYVRSPEEMYAAMPGPRGGAGHLGADRRAGRAAYESLDFETPLLPVVPAAGRARRPRTTCASCARQGLRERYGDDPPAEALRPARARARHHQPDGLRLLLPDRLGLRALRPRGGHPRLGPRLGLRGARQLRAQAQPRLPAEVRPAVRAVPRPEPLRGARHRHRLLPGAARRGDRVRPARSTARPTSPRSARSARWGAKAAIKDVGRALEHPAGAGRPDHQAGARRG